MKQVFMLFLGALVVSNVHSFTFGTQDVRSTTALSNHISRRNAIQGLLTPAIATVVTSFSQPAFADVTNKVASQSALRYMKRSMKELEKLEFYASNNDYSEIKQGIRSPALSEIRKNAKVLIKGGEDGPEAENLQVAYDAFIKDIESLDGDASLGFRGRKGIQMYPNYEKSVKSLAAFTEIAAKSVTIPMASTDE